MQIRKMMIYWDGTHEMILKSVLKEVDSSAKKYIGGYSKSYDSD